MHFVEWHYIASCPCIDFNVHLMLFRVLRLCNPGWTDMLTLLIGTQSGDLYSLEAVAFCFWQLFSGFEVQCGVLCSLCTLVIVLQRLLKLWMLWSCASNMCKGVSLLLHSQSRDPFLPHLPHIEFLALHTLECSLVQFGAPQ